MKRLHQAASVLGLADRVRFAGMVPPDEVGRYYALADAFVSASTSEAQGLTYLEALAAGVPLLCRDDPCVRGFLAAAPCGWTYRTPGELAALAAALPCGAEAAPLRRAARQAAAPYSREQFGMAVEALYRRLILQRAVAPLPAGRRVILW